MFYKFLCFVLCARFSYCANILALVPAISYSHQIAFAPLWNELSLRGHNVTVLTTNPLRNPKLTNLTELDIRWAYNFFKNVSHHAETTITMWNFQKVLYNLMNQICGSVLSSDIGQNLLHNENDFDLVIAENVCPEFLAFAEVYKCPKILFATMGLPATFYTAVGDFVHPVSHPELTLPFHGNLNFQERVISTFMSWYLHFMFTYVYFPERQLSLQKYFNTSSTIMGLIGSIDLLFLNVNPLIHGPRPIGPATILLDGHRKDISLQPMPSDIKKFLDDAKEGCILVSLGGNIKSSELSHSLLRGIIDALREVPYKVLWKFENHLADMPENVKTAKWLPQQKILNHPNVKLFISHGGLQSIEESIYGEVPFVIIPFFGDQYQNARILEHKGIAVVLDRQIFSKSDLKNAIMKVMTEKRYHNEVRKLKSLILDEPMSGLERAVWWTEYVIRNKGAKHLRNPAADLPFYQSYLLDVLGFLLFSAILVVTIIVIVLKKILKLFWKLSYRKEKLQ